MLHDFAVSGNRMQREFRGRAAHAPTGSHRTAQNCTEREFSRKGFRVVLCGSVANTAGEPPTPRQEATELHGTAQNANSAGKGFVSFCVIPWQTPQAGRPRPDSDKRLSDERKARTSAGGVRAFPFRRMPAVFTLPLRRERPRQGRLRRRGRRRSSRPWARRPTGGRPSRCRRCGGSRRGRRGCSHRGG